MLTKSLQEGWNKNIEPTVEKYIDKVDNWADEIGNEMNEYFEDLAEKMTRLGGE